MKFRRNETEKLADAVQQQAFKSEAERAFEEAAAEAVQPEETLSEEKPATRKSLREARRELKAQDEALRASLDETRDEADTEEAPREEEKPVDFVQKTRVRRRRLAVAAFVLLVGIGILGNWYYENTDFTGAVRPLITGSDTKTLGEAEFVGATTTVAADAGENDYFSATRMEREKAREEALEKLQAVIDSAEESPEAKQTATEAISRLSNYISVENKIESLVAAKGVKHCLAVVSIDGMKVDVIVDCDELTDELTLQIKEIAMQQLGCAFDAVTIIQSNE